MLEQKYIDAGYHYIFGMDEVGRGPMAGPLVAAAVCLPLADPDLNDLLKGVKDSKQMTSLQREEAAKRIKEVALAWGIGEVEAEEMPQVGNMTAVTLEAMRRALAQAQQQSGIQPDFLLMDYYRYPHLPADRQESFKKGDTLSLTIAAASVIAKVYRDNLMIEFAEEFPMYGFDAHKGYPTRQHMTALRTYGPCPLHRSHYAPVRQASMMTRD